MLKTQLFVCVNPRLKLVIYGDAKFVYHSYANEELPTPYLIPQR